MSNSDLRGDEPVTGANAPEMSEDVSSIDMASEYEHVLEEEHRKDESLKKADLVTSIVIFLIGLFFFLGGQSMPVEQLTGSKDLWYLAPGAFPSFLGLALIIQALFLFGYSVKGGLDVFSAGNIKVMRDYLKSSGFKKLSVIFLLVTAYIFLFLRNIPYWAATYLFLASTMIIFEEQRTAKNIIKMLIISAITTGAVTYGFAVFARIPLP